MSKFNAESITKSKLTTNIAGGSAYTQSPELALISTLLTSFAQNEFYRNENQSFEEIKRLISLCDKKFAAQAAIFARKEFGMRSITHVMASELAKYIGGQKWAKNFYESIIYRPDDMTEILSYHTKFNGKMSNAMKAGFSKAFNKFDAYSLSKYRSENKEFKLVDVVNLVHPIGNEKNSQALSDLVNGKLKSSDTWESRMSKAGQNEEGDVDEMKSEVWSSLLNEKRMPYFALLRNLRNIMLQSPESLGKAMDLLVNEKEIKKSLVLPFRFMTAYDEIKKFNTKESRALLIALNQAVDVSLNNVPVFDGETLVVLDTSSSMKGKASTIGSLFSAILVKSNNADFMTFDSTARYAPINIADSTLTIADSMRFAGGSTKFESIFQTANKAYDRVVILSDMQNNWPGNGSSSLVSYKNKFNCNPFIYHFDLKGYGSMQIQESKCFAMAGFSDKIFNIMSVMESDKKALITSVKSVSI